MSRPDDRRALAARCRGYVSGVQAAPLNRQRVCTLQGRGGVFPADGGSTGHCILIGQFTVPKGKKFGGSGLISGATLDEYAAFSSQ